MRKQIVNEHDSRVQAALAELRELIGKRYPLSTFEVFRGEDPDGMYLRATVDVEDSDAVLDVVIDRLYEFQVEQELPVYVIPVRPLARIMQELHTRPARPSPPNLSVLFQG